MKKVIKALAAVAAVVSFSMSGPAQAEADYPYAATAHLEAGGMFLSRENCQGPGCDNDIARIVGGADLVIPQSGYWNLQIGGSLQTLHAHFPFGGSTSITHMQASAIAFWRNQNTGVFGLEVGLYSPDVSGRERIKVGGVAQYYFSEMLTVGAFGGALIPLDDTPAGPRLTLDTGFYAGGDLTWYASDNAAIAGSAQFFQAGNRFRRGPFDNITTRRAVRGGVTGRYLTSFSGVELTGSANYVNCQEEFERRVSTTTDNDGFEFLVGVNVRLGGHGDSLAAIDRSNALDTRAWGCSNRF